MRSGADTSTTIADVRARVVAAPIDEPVRLSFGTLDRRYAFLLELELTDGTTGYGESWVNWPEWAAFERLAALEHGLGRHLVGRDAEDVEGIRDDLMAALVPMGAQANAIGPIMHAVSGVDLALWDLNAKVSQQPLSDLIGGERERVPVYASSVGPGRGVEALCQRIVEMGFTTLKVRVGFDDRTDNDVLDRVRATIGSRLRIIADANRAWSVDESVSRGQMLAKHGVEMVEEPLRSMDVASVESWYDRTGIPVALGENLYDIREFETAIGSPAVAAIQPDLTKNGGFTLGLQLARLTDSTMTNLTPHSYGSPVGFLASLHLLAGTGVEGAVEFPIGPNAPFWGMVGGPPSISAGTTIPPRGAGFTGTLDVTWIEEATIARSVQRW